jgi:2-polyprenyl-6-hydroxyphenyl methylase/3-demethylubiquinone-9 3-methyltransferase
MYKLVKFTSNRSLEEAREIYNQRISDSLKIFQKYKDNFIKRPCFLCGNDDFIALDKFHNAYEIVKCNICMSQSVNPAPSEDALIDYYNAGKSNILLDQLLKSRYKKNSNFIIDDRIKIVLELIYKLNKFDINILEIGCSSGAFLSKLKYFSKKNFPDKNFSFKGIDIDSNAIQSRVDDNLDLTTVSAEAYVKSSSVQYDIILHFELIEHLLNPHSFMTSLFQLLRDDGFMFFSTPNSEGLEMIASGYNSYRPLAHSIFPPMHLNAFSMSNIVHFAIRSGFKVVKVSTPGKLDVDMLSIFEGELELGLKKISDLDENTKGLIQYLVSYLGSSSHMRCILKK